MTYFTSVHFEYIASGKGHFSMAVHNLNLKISAITKSFNGNSFLRLNFVQTFFINPISFRRGFAAVKKGKTEKQPTVDASESNKMPTPKVIALPKPFPLLSYPRITKVNDIPCYF